jgi:hypothetical protein
MVQRPRRCICRGHWKFPFEATIETAMSMFRDVSFAGVGSDLIAYLRTPRQHRWLLVILACAPPAFIIMLFNLDLRDVGKPGEPEITYIESWPADRSLKEIIESNIANQKIKDEQERRAREAYKALGRATGMDVDRIEREALAEQAKKAAAAKDALAKSSAAAGAAK